MIASRTAAGTALAVALLLVAGPAAAATPTPYDVTVNGVTLTDGTTFPAHGHVNYRTTLRSGGVHFDPNNGQPGGAYIGQGFLPIPLAPGECIVWVQYSGTNYHYGEQGEPPVCASPSPSPSPSETTTPSPSPSSSPSTPATSGPEPTPTATVTPTATPTPTPSASATVAPSPSESATPPALRSATDSLTELPATGRDLGGAIALGTLLLLAGAGAIVRSVIGAKA